MRGRRKGLRGIIIGKDTVADERIDLGDLSALCSRQLEPYELAILFTNILDNVGKKGPWILDQVCNIQEYHTEYLALCELQRLGKDVNKQFTHLGIKYKDKLSAFKN